MKLSKAFILIPFILIGCGPKEEVAPEVASSKVEQSVVTPKKANGTNTAEELRAAFQEAITSQDRGALLSLYHTSDLNGTSLELLESSIKQTLGVKEISKDYTVSHIETLNYSNFGTATNGEIIAYYPSKYLSGALYLAFHYKERSGRGLRTFPIIQVDHDEYYLAARRVEDLPQEVEQKFYSISLKDDQFETFAPLFVTYAIGEYIQMKELPGRQGQLRCSELLSISCPPIPTAEEATLVIVNPQDDEDVLLELDFNPQFGLYWKNQKANRVDGSINSPVPHITGHTGP